MQRTHLRFAISRNRAGRISLAAAIVCLSALQKVGQAATTPPASDPCTMRAIVSKVDGRNYALDLQPKDPHADAMTVVLASERFDHVVEVPPFEAGTRVLPEPATPASASRRPVPPISKRFFVRLAEEDTILAARIDRVGDRACSRAYQFTVNFVANDAQTLRLATDGQLSAAAPLPIEARCNAPFTDGGFIERAEVHYPEIARVQGRGGRVMVRVTVGPGGTVRDAMLMRSSGTASLDQEALRAARASRYSQRTFRCEGIVYDAYFIQDFTPS